MKRTGLTIMLCGALALGAVTGCTGTSNASSTSENAGASTTAVVSGASQQAQEASGASAASQAGPSAGAMPSGSMSAAPSGAMPSGEAPGGASAGASGGAPGAATDTAGRVDPSLDTSSVFTDRDMEQEADTSSAKSIEVKSGEDVTISEEGVYVLSGTATDATITVDADSSAKVQLVLNGLNVENADAPAIYVVSADKVFVTTASGSSNNLSVTGEFVAIGEDNVDGAIFAKDDLVLNGKGTLTINSTQNGVVGKDDVKVTGGTYEITAANHGIQGKDSVAIADGTFNITAGKDGIHSSNDDDQTLGYVYVAGGTFNIKSESDGIEGDGYVQIDGGTFDMDSAEGIEGTFVQINDGNVRIQAADDGINATGKSTAYSVRLEINGGTVDVSMASGDTDALDSNGDLYINGGTVNITGQSAFDFDGSGQLNGGTVTVNGEQVTELTGQMMGGMGGHGGMGGRGNRGDMSGMSGMQA